MLHCLRRGGIYWHNKFHQIWPSCETQSDCPKMIKLPMYVSVRFWNFGRQWKNRATGVKVPPILAISSENAADHDKCGRQSVTHLNFPWNRDSWRFKAEWNWGKFGEIAEKVVFSRYCREPHWLCPKWGPMKQNELVRRWSNCPN